MKAEQAMELKTYRAKTMQEALALVRGDLGPSASVLHTREAPASGLLNRIAGRKVIEVTASNQVAVASRLPSSKRADASHAVAHAPAAERLVVHSEVKSQLAQLQAMVEDLRRRAPVEPQSAPPRGLDRVLHEMLRADAPLELAREIVEETRGLANDADLFDYRRARALAFKVVRARLTTSGPILPTPGRPRLVALVGPTGAGKTTTIAKLAALFHRRHKCRVGLINLDTRRIGAAAQISAYAEIIDLPLKTANDGTELQTAVEEFARLDLVLIDTCGKSPHDHAGVHEMRVMLSAAGVDETHVVLGGGSSASTVSAVLTSFGAAGATSLLLTKLDEARCLGPLLTATRAHKTPLSYTTHGQNVPDDIEIADVDKLIARMMGPE